MAQRQEADWSYQEQARERERGSSIVDVADARTTETTPIFKTLQSRRTDCSQSTYCISDTTTTWQDSKWVSKAVIHLSISAKYFTFTASLLHQVNLWEECWAFTGSHLLCFPELLDDLCSHLVVFQEVIGDSVADPGGPLCRTQLQQLVPCLL